MWNLDAGSLVLSFPKLWAKPPGEQRVDQQTLQISYLIHGKYCKNWQVAMTPLSKKSQPQQKIEADCRPLKVDFV